MLEVDALAQRSARREASFPQAPSQTASFQASRWCIPRPRKTGREVASRTWWKSPRVHSSMHAHSSASTIEREPGSSTRPARESITTMRVRPMSRL